MKPHLRLLAASAALLNVACTTTELASFPEAFMEMAAAVAGVPRTHKPLDTSQLATSDPHSPYFTVRAAPTAPSVQVQTTRPAGTPVPSLDTTVSGLPEGQAAGSMTLYSTSELSSVGSTIGKALSDVLGRSVAVKQVSSASRKGGLEEIEGGPGDGRTLLLSTSSEVYSVIDSGLVDNNQIAVLTELEAESDSILLMAPRSTKQEIAKQIIAAANKVQDAPEVRAVLDGSSSTAPPSPPPLASQMPVAPGSSSTSTMKSGRGLAAVVDAGASSSGNRGASCPQNLSHLASSLPRYGDPQLDQLRQQILSTVTEPRLRDIMAKQGLSPGDLANLLVKQAEEFERGAPQAEQCIRASANNAESIINSLRSGSYDMSGRYSGVNDWCARAYVAYYYGSVYNREMARAASCMAR